MSDVNVETEPMGTQAEKRQRKLSLKGTVFALEKMQKERSEVLKNASKIKSKITELWLSNKNVSEVKQHIEKFNMLCEKASCLHDTLLNDFNLPEDEHKRQNAWFQEKGAANNEFVNKVHNWLKQNEKVCNELDAANVEVENCGGGLDHNVNPEDSVSNVSSKCCKRSHASSTSSAHKQALADQAALLAKAEALKRTHELEELEQRHRLEADKIRKQKEQLELDAQLAAAAARLSVLESSSVGGKSKSMSDGMNSYVSKGLKEQIRAEFNPQAKEFVSNTATYTAPLGFTASAPPVLPGRKRVYSSAKLEDEPHYPKPPLYGAVVPNSKLDGLSSVNVKPKPFPFQPSDLQLQGTHKAHMQQQLNDQSIPNHDVICTIMQKQNEITSMLVQQQLSATLPQREIPVFDGNPLECMSFLRAFEHCVEERTNNYQDCLYLLEQYTRGQPRELVRSCMHMSSQQGYQRAKELIMEHFGNEYHIASAYMEKVFAWPVIKSEDVEELQEFALFLRGCCNAMLEIQYMEELNVPSHMRQVIMKLPYKLRERWRITACKLQERQGFRATFNDMVSFLEQQVKILSHPLFGDISDTKPSPIMRGPLKAKSLLKANIKGSSFVTSVSAPESASAPIVYKQPIVPNNPPSSSCLYCEQPHLTSKCQELQRISHKEKIEFLRFKGVCFGCLKVGHISKECKGRLTCDKCYLKHPTILHLDSGEPSVSSAFVSHQVGACTGAGDHDCALSIVPVKVRSKRGDTVLQTYAFLDPGSTTTFITSGLMNRLNLQGKRTNILLCTMGQEKLVPSHCVSGLEISELEGNNFIEIPEVYTQETIPVSRTNIPRQQDVEKWKYLKTIKITELDTDVGLLIGTNAPKLLEPWEIINSKGDGPYAVRTLLGWVINGPLRNGNGGQKSCPTIYTNRISIVKLEELFMSQYNTEFSEKALEEEHEIQNEDKRPELAEPPTLQGVESETVADSQPEETKSSPVVPYTDAILLQPVSPVSSPSEHPFSPDCKASSGNSEAYLVSVGSKTQSEDPSEEQLVDEMEESGWSATPVNSEQPDKLYCSVGDAAVFCSACNADEKSAPPITEEMKSVSTVQILELQKVIDDLSSRLEKRESQLLAVSKDKAKLEEECDNLKDEVISLKEESSTVNSLQEEFTQRIADAERKAQLACKERDIAKKEIKGWREDLATRLISSDTLELIREKEEQIGGLLEEGEKLSKQQLQQSTIIKKLRVKEKESDSRITKQQKKIKELEEELRHLQQVLDGKEKLEDESSRESAELINLKGEHSRMLEEAKKERLLLTNQLEMEKMKVDQKKKKGYLAQEALKEKERKAVTHTIGELPAASTPSLSRSSSIVGEKMLDCTLLSQDDSLDHSLGPMTLSVSGTNLYEAARLSGGSSIIENLQSQLKLREGEIAQLQLTISSLERSCSVMDKRIFTFATGKTKWSRPRRSFAVDDIMVVVDHSAPHGSWILRRVTKTYPDKHGLVRAVQLKTQTGQLGRQISSSRSH